MNTNNTQMGNIPSEPFFANNNNESNIDQQLSIKIVTTTQSLIEFTTTNMISSQIQLIHNIPEHDKISRTQ